MSFQNWFVFWVTSYWTNSLINQAELANTTCKRLGMLNTPIMEIIQLLTQLKNATSVWEKNKKKRKKVTKMFFCQKLWNPEPCRIGSLFNLHLLICSCKFIMIETRGCDIAHAGFDNSRTSRTYVRLILLAYAWFCTCVRWHVHSFFPYDFVKFLQFFLVLIILYCLNAYCYIFDL